jgi:DnaJ like chaperone protein
MLDFLGKILATLILAPILFYVGDVMGLAVGLMLGGCIDFLRSLSGPSAVSERKRIRDGHLADFIVSTLLLSAAVIRADGKMDELELGYLRRFLAEQFGEARALEYMAIFKTAYNGEYNVETTAKNVAKTTAYETRLQLVYIMTGIAKSNFDLDDREKVLIEKVVTWLEVSLADYEALKSMFSSDLDAYYKILEITPSASDADVKAAYRAVAAKFHPDKVAHLGDEMSSTATRKFQKLQTAFVAIRQSRGF